MGVQSRNRRIKRENNPQYGVPKSKLKTDYPQVYYNPNVSVNSYQGEYSLPKRVLQLCLTCDCNTYCNGRAVIQVSHCGREKSR